MPVSLLQAAAYIPSFCTIRKMNSNYLAANAFCLLLDDIHLAALVGL